MPTSRKVVRETTVADYLFCPRAKVGCEQKQLHGNAEGRPHDPEENSRTHSHPIAPRENRNDTDDQIDRTEVKYRITTCGNIRRRPRSIARDMNLGRYEKTRLPSVRAEPITGQAATTTGNGKGGPRREIAPRSRIAPRRSAAYRTPERGSSRAGRGENVDSRVDTSPATARYNRSAAAMSRAHSIVAAA